MLANNGVPRRPSRGSRSGVCFLMAVVILLASLYSGYLLLLLLPFLVSFPLHGIIVAIVFHVSFGLLCTSFLKCVTTDPGEVPPNWGFYMGDDTKRRRYCKVCNVWKPDRTHHCSACGRCVLNMDHHCPWINNCVGFYNRKFFIQLLVYALASLGFVALQGFHYIFQQSLAALHHHRVTVAPELRGWAVTEYILVCLLLFVSLTLLFALVPFSRFHLELVTRNSTTIENMDQTNRDRNKYDLGLTRNIEQVFGTNPCCWLAPCHTYRSRPIGDGVRWSVHYANVADDLEMEPQRNNRSSQKPRTATTTGPINPLQQTLGIY